MNAEQASDELVFDRSATEAAGLLRIAIQRQEDFVASTGAFVAANPDITSAELSGWIDSVSASERYPELYAAAFVRYVPAAELPAFEALLARDAAAPVNAEGRLDIIPPGDREFYCLVQSVVAFAESPVVALYGVDYCATEMVESVLAARDSGIGAAIVVPDEESQRFVVQSPIYRGGAVPDTLEGRRDAYIGSLGTVLVPEVLLHGVFDGDASEMISLVFHRGDTPVSFGDSVAPVGATVLVKDLGPGWTVEIAHMAGTNTVLSTPMALTRIIVGTFASLTLGLLVFTLGTGRKRALRLVAESTDELRHQALHDALTNLPNRTLIVDRAEQMLARCRRNGGVGSALFLDLDGFKNINDTLGHEAGDQLLQAVAARLTTGLRGVDTIGRLGGDEFVVLVESGDLHQDVSQVADRILDLLRQPFELDLAPAPIMISTSIGIASGDRADAGDLLRDADIALYESKAAGRNRYEQFRPDMEAAVQHQFELEFDLRSALANEQFRLHYQPIYDLSDLSLIGTEALLRWEHPTRGTIQPDDFIALLEGSGQIVEVGRWVLNSACFQAQRWLDSGDDLTVSVNLSARQLDRDGIVDDVSEALRVSRLDPAHLTLEITETAIMKDTALTVQRLHALKALGVKIAIDDFGSGYSSLAYLQQFPVDCLKIDRAFTNAITRTPESDALIHTLVQLGKDLGLQTLAEGVETAGQLDHLRVVSVDQGQGFLLARPLSAADFESQLLLSTTYDTAPTTEPA